MPNATDFLPLKPLVLEVLLSLTDGERHGWSLVREIQQRTGGHRVLPANLYRMLRGLLADGLIEDAGLRDGEGAPRRYFTLTALGRDVARTEVRRLQALITDQRARRLLSGRSRS